jgi:hypothetical protein
MRKLQVDPVVMFWFGILTNILILIAGYGFDHAPTIIAQWAPDMQWVAGFLAKISSIILTAMAAVSSSNTGPLVPK